MRARTLVPPLLVGLGLACTPEPVPASTPEPAAVEAPPQPERPPIPALGLELGLPPPPSFPLADVPMLDEDRTWSIQGLRGLLEPMIDEGEAGRMVLVSAYVQEVYAPPQCPEGELCPPGKQPHAWLVDAPALRGKQRALMLIGYSFPIPEWDEQTQFEWAGEPEVVLEPGLRYVFMGRFVRFSDSGFAHDLGLLELFAITDYPLTPESRWIIPRNSQDHPKARAAMGLPPVEPELARVPAGISPGAPRARLEPLVEPRDRNDAHQRGWAAARAGDPALADYYYRWLIVDAPEDPLGWVELANFYIDNGEDAAGRAIIDMAIARSPDDARLHNGRGRLLLNLGEPAAAVEAYLRAVELAPDAADAWFGLGIAYAELPERERAIEALERFLTIAGDAPPHVVRAAQDVIMRMGYP